MNAGKFSLGLVLLTGCASGGADFPALREHRPVSILVLPPLNASSEAEAPWAWLSTVTRPLAERGYYVFPVHVVMAYMRENGLSSPEEMQQISLQNLDKTFGADAVLFGRIDYWGQTEGRRANDSISGSQTRVTVTLRLVHVKTKILLWEGSMSKEQWAGGNNTSAFLNQIKSSTNQLALVRKLNWDLFHESRGGLLPGPYSRQKGD